MPFGSSTDLTFFTLHTQFLGDHSCRFNIRIDQQYTDNLWLESERPSTSFFKCLSSTYYAFLSFHFTLAEDQMILRGVDHIVFREGGWGSSHR